ncbi:hypothetical protein CY652_11045 [Burkholderia sp. WAC0059]|uniref:OmpA family protein n=1 Tax=Burkholderia sp. WAC0059 TaxID=2066022 RepID=UPI000C7F63DB|nr:OmpA family protein [Burkholderia sp. WAC0059]PLZ02269.1 hypothetical protein CY652_11045 [Burkholderia sp. WAC0059]
MKNLRLPRPSAATRVLLAVLAATAAAQAAHAQIMVLTPPPAVYVAPPVPRAGLAWQPGYWGWQYGGYVWVPGHWVAVGPVGMPPPPPPVAQVLRLSADALFAFDRGSAPDILPGGRAEIADAAARLRSSRFSRIEVRGYTDRLGSPGYNLQLSRRRAAAVKALLVADGLPADRIDAVGRGAADPVSQCGNALPRPSLIDCLQPDRRVEIVVYADRTAG